MAIGDSNPPSSRVHNKTRKMPWAPSSFPELCPGSLLFVSSDVDGVIRNEDTRSITSYVKRSDDRNRTEKRSLGQRRRAGLYIQVRQGGRRCRIDVDKHGIGILGIRILLRTRLVGAERGVGLCTPNPVLGRTRRVVQVVIESDRRGGYRIYQGSSH